jgi:hypothetical protein
MVFEKLPYHFNIQKLQGFLMDTVIPIGDPFYPIEEGFGGWSVTSDTGHWKDGWYTGEELKDPDMYNKPTELYKGYMAEVLDFIKEQGFKITKVRISVLPPKSKSTIHRDYHPLNFRSRLHIPILTNEQCCHIIYNNGLTEKTEFHMPANGEAFMFWVNLKHQYVNMSNEKRYHLVMDAIDTKGITENFKCITQ